MNSPDDTDRTRHRVSGPASVLLIIILLMLFSLGAWSIGNGQLATYAGMTAVALAASLPMAQSTKQGRLARRNRRGRRARSIPTSDDQPAASDTHS